MSAIHWWSGGASWPCSEYLELPRSLLRLLTSGMQQVLQHVATHTHTASCALQMEEYLESTYSVNPFPEPFVRHRLHVVTCLPLAAVDDWFVRRCSAQTLSGSLVSPSTCLPSQTSELMCRHALHLP